MDFNDDGALDGYFMFYCFFCYAYMMISLLVRVLHAIFTPFVRWLLFVCVCVYVA